MATEQDLEPKCLLRKLHIWQQLLVLRFAESVIANFNTPRSLAQIIPRTKRQGLAVLETNMLGSLSGRLDTSFDIVKLYCLWYAVKATVGEGLSDQLLHSKN